MVPIRDAEHFVDALNQAAEIEGGPQPRIETLLHSLQRLLGRDGRSALWLLEDLDRRPLPRIVNRYVVRPAWDATPALDLESLQQVIDGAASVFDAIVPTIRANIRTPYTIIVSESEDAHWFEQVLAAQLLEPLGYVDSIASMWAASDSRAVMLANLRRASDPPYTEKDVSLMSLMLRAAAPLIDREVFRPPDILGQRKLSPRQQEVLLMLLSGDSEKEIAAQLSRSVHTVHTFVGQIYDLFNVQSRGELMAMFIDKKVLERSSVGTTG